ncbi:LysR substrate-binding domain-containing protein [Paludibacterium paludis]|nr:LysR substrate-binding domain-containing protein [Paludibacterium paludis]
MASLNGIRVFVIAARQGSFQEAARELCVTPGAVSRQIQSLESLLAVPLFVRMPRKVELTPAGVALLEAVGPALGAIEEACRQIATSGRQSVVCLESTPTFAMHWLIPRLSLFHAEHPDVQVELRTTQGVIDKSHTSHIYIRRCPEQFAGLTGTPFMKEYSILVCSPDYWHKHRVRCPADVARSRLVAMRSRQDLWPKWFAHHGIADNPEDGRMGLDNTILAIQAATRGLGIAFIPQLFLADALAAGILMPVPGFPPLQTGTYSWLSQQFPLSRAAGTFVNWLTDSAREAQRVADAAPCPTGNGAKGKPKRSS